jgi:superfamily II DNA or RNA helicase
VQTLSRRDIAPHDMVIIDEAHVVFKLYGKLMGDPRWEGVPFVGLSATPWTKGLGKHFKRLIVGGTIGDGIEEGWLSPYRAFAPSTPDLSKVKTLAGDYQVDQLADVMDVPKLTADIVDTWRMLGEDRPTFLFAVNRAHAFHLAEEFRRVGISSAYVDAFTPLDEREEIRQRFESGEVRVVANVGVLTTGIDWDVRCIILARPTKSEMLYVQMMGRGLRPTPDGKPHKTDCIILDHAGASLKLGLPADIHHDELDDGRPKKPAEAREKPTPLPKPCPKCHFLKPPRVHACPACGFAPTAQSTLEVAPGSLVEIPQRAQFDMETKSRWYRMRMHEQRTNGYKDGWLGNSFREKFGVWPNAFRSINTTLVPDEEVRTWLIAKRIRWIKGQGRRAA